MVQFSQLLKTGRADHVLHPAGVLLGSFGLYASVYQQAGEKAVLLIGLLGYLLAYISQAEEEILIHGEETTFFQGGYHMAHAGF